MKPGNTIFLPVVVIVSSLGNAATVDTVASGQWDTAVPWGMAPSPADTYRIVAGHNVTTPNTAGTFTFGGGGLEVVSGELQLKMEHNASSQTGSYSVPSCKLSGGSLVFDASNGTAIWNFNSAIDLAAATNSKIVIRDGNFGTDANLTGALTGAGNIAFESNRSDENDDRAKLYVKSSNNTFSGNWSAQGFDTGINASLYAAAAGALGTGTVSLLDRGALYVDVNNGIDGLGGITLDHSAARLHLNNRNWTSPTGILTVNDGVANLGTSAVSIGSMSQAGGTVNLTVGGAVNGKLTTSGNAAFTGGTINLAFVSNPAGGSFEVISYGGSLSGIPAFNVGDTGRLTPVVNTGSGTNDKVTVSFTGAVANLVWKGNVDANWDNNATANFNNGASADVFRNYDHVTFDQTAATFTPQLATALTAGTVTLDGAANYTFGGAGSLAGSTSIVKNGSGTATFTTSNANSGPTTISAGTIRVGSGGGSGALSSASAVTIGPSGTLRHFRSSATTLSFPVTGTGTWYFEGTGVSGQSPYTLSGNASGFSGSLIADKAQLLVDNYTNDAGTSTVKVYSGGQLFLTQPGTFSNNVEIVGTGWLESSSGAPHGALRLFGGTVVTGTITLTGNAQISARETTGAISGIIAESGGAHSLDLRGTSTSTSTSAPLNTTLTLSNSSSRTGATSVTGAIVVAQNSSALGSGPITIQGNGTVQRVTRLDLQGVTISNDVTVASNAQTGFLGPLTGIGGVTSTVNGNVTVTTAPGNGGHIASSGVGSVLRLMGGLNVGGAMTSIVQRDGIVEYGGGANTSYTLTVTGTARLAAHDGIGSGVHVSIGASAASTFDMNGFNSTVAGVQKTGTTHSATITNSGAADSTLTVSNSTGRSFAGVIQDGTKKINLVKSGPASFTLSGANTYSGTTTVTAGTLAGTGSANSNLTVQSGGTLNPGVGAAIGTFAAKDAAFQAGGSLSIQLDSSGTPASDLLDADGPVSIAAGTLLAVTDVATSPVVMPVGVELVILDYTGHSLSGTFNGLAEGAELNVGLNKFLISYNDSSRVTLTSNGASVGYSAWAVFNAGNQGPHLDFDKDGVPNGIEFFMGETGSSFTANPPLVAGQVTWPKAPSFIGTYAVRISTDLVTWTTASTGVVDHGASVQYTLPTGNPKHFVRLEVVIP